MRRAAVVPVWALFMAGSAALAQQPPVLQPTTVQLPTFRVFTVQTTVSVPDSGGTYLGGIQRARDGSLTRGMGPLAGRARGSDRTASGASVRATMIDHREHEAALLAAAAARRSGTPIDPAVPKARSLTRDIAAATAPPESLAAIRAANAAAALDRAREAAKYFAQGRQAEAEGKTGAARIYYQRAARNDTGEVKQRAEQRLAALATR